MKPQLNSYEETCFLAYRARLKREFEEVIHPAIKQGLGAELGGEARLRGWWVALGAQFDPNNPTQRGFAVAGSYFCDRADAKVFSGLVDKRGAELAKQLPADIAKYPFYRRFANENLQRPEEDTRKLQELCVGGSPDALKAAPRDYAVSLGLPCIAAHIPSADKADNGKAEGRRVAFLHSTANNAEFLVVQTTRGLDKPADETLRGIGDALGGEVKSGLLLCLFPVTQFPVTAENMAEAVVASVLEVPLSTIQTIQLHEGNAVAAKVVANDDADPRLVGLRNFIQRCHSEVSGNPIILSAVAMIRDAYRRHPKNIRRLIDTAEEQALGDSRFPDDKRILDPLVMSLGVLKEEGSPLEFALDGACAEILSVLRGLVHSIKFDKLMSPVLRFAVQERLLLGAGERRDHYLHTLKVFLLGRAILKHLDCYDGFFRPRWILASVFHDVCYPLQKAEEWAGETIKSFFKKGIQFRLDSLPLLNNWKGRGYEICPIDLFLRTADQRLNHWMTTPLDGRFWDSSEGRRFQSVVAQQLIDKNHAVLSAFSLLLHADEQYPECRLNRIQQDTVPRTPADEEGQRRKTELLDAATAILLHDSKLWSAMLPARFRLSTVPFVEKDPIPLNEAKVNVLAWTLAITDVLQEWGRDSWVDDIGTVISTELSPSATTCTFTPSPSKLDVQLRYGRRFEETVKNTAEEARNEIVAALRALDSGQKRHLEFPSEITYDKLRSRSGQGFVWMGADNRDPRGSGEGLDYVPARETAKLVSLILPVLAAMHDLIGDDCPVGGTDWCRAIVGLGMVAGQIGEGESRRARLELGRDLRDFVSRDKIFKKTASLLKKLHGFQRVPRGALCFWGPCSNLPLRVARYVEKDANAIDVLSMSNP